jgi:serine/threonine-protein kinase
VHGYRIVRKIAVGGTAWVFEATHIESNRRVAMKVLNDQYRGEPCIVKRFANEARAAMSLDSPHIVAIETVGTLSQGLPYLVMEYLDGVDLYHALQSAGWRLTVEHALYIVDQVARALEIAHERGIVHRDIKPENIFLLDTPQGMLAKVLDFGLSRVPRAGSFSALTRTGTTVGTPHYMALEQLRGDRTIDARADVYSLGVLTYELLSGHCPFEGDDLHDVMLRAARDQAPPLSNHRPDLPAGLLKAVAHAMQRDRDKRCPSARAFREAIRPFWSGETPNFEPAHPANAPTLDIAPTQTSNVPSPPKLVPSEAAAPKPLHTARDNHPQASPRPQKPRATVAAVLLALSVLALGITCFVVDTVRGTPERAEATLSAQP